MAQTRIEIKHGVISDAMVQLGYKVRGVCNGTTLKWTEAVLLGPEEEQKFIDRLQLIANHHTRWNLYRRRNANKLISSEDNYIVLEGDPSINKISYYKNNQLIIQHEIDFNDPRLLKKLNKKQKKKLETHKNGIIDLDNDKKKLITDSLLKGAPLAYSELITEINNVKKKAMNHEALTDRDMQFLDVLAFFDGVALFQRPEEYADVFKGYELHFRSTLPENLDDYKDSHIYLIDTKELYYIHQDGRSERINFTMGHEIFEEYFLKKDTNDILMTEERYQTFNILLEKKSHFKRNLDQSDVNKIAPFAQSKMAETQHKAMECCYSAPRTFDLKTLSAYFAELEKMTGLERDQLVIGLGCDDHRIGLKYDQKSKQWKLFNINTLPPILLSSHLSSNQDELASHIMKAFDDDKITTFGLTVYTSTQFKDQNKLISQLETIDKQFPINDERLSKLKNSRGYSIVDIAALENLTDHLKLLGNYLVLDENSLERTFLHRAAGNGNIAFCQEVIKLNPTINLNVVGKDNDCPIHAAVLFNHIDFVIFLLEHNIALNIPNEDGDLPLHMAIDYGHKQIAELLLNKMDPHDLVKKNNDGKTPLALAIELQDFSNGNRILLKMNASDLTMLDDDNNNYIQLALLNSSLSIIPDILNKVGDDSMLTHQNNEGQNFFHLIVNTFLKKDAEIQKIYIDLLKPFIGHVNIDTINVENNDGKTPLQMALKSKKSLELIKLFREKMGDDFLKKKDKNGNTPLHLAAKYGNDEVIDFLLKELTPKQLDVKNNEGETALDLAVKRGKEKTIKLLKSFLPEKIISQSESSSIYSSPDVIFKSQITSAHVQTQDKKIAKEISTGTEVPLSTQSTHRQKKD